MAVHSAATEGNSSDFSVDQATRCLFRLSPHGAAPKGLARARHVCRPALVTLAAEDSKTHPKEAEKSSKCPARSVSASFSSRWGSKGPRSTGETGCEELKSLRRLDRQAQLQCGRLPKAPRCLFSAFRSRLSMRFLQELCRIEVQSSGRTSPRPLQLRPLRQQSRAQPAWTWMATLLRSEWPQASSGCLAPCI